MRASLVDVVAKAISGAWKAGRRTPAGVAAALEAAGLLAGPGELAGLRLQVAGLSEELAASRRATAAAALERDEMRERVSEPYGCGHCGTERSGHGHRWMSEVGLHQWVAPSDEQVLSRMLARRAARAYTFDVAALRRERDELKARIAELEQATADRAAIAVEQNLRAIEQGNPGAAFTHDCNLPLARRLDCGHCPHELCADCGRCPHICRCAAGGAPAVEALHAASGAVIEPRGPQEDPHDSPLHSDYRLSHDLPETPGATR